MLRHSAAPPHRACSLASHCTSTVQFHILAISHALALLRVLVVIVVACDIVCKACNKTLRIRQLPSLRAVCCAFAILLCCCCCGCMFDRIIFHIACKVCPKSHLKCWLANWLVGDWVAGCRGLSKPPNAPTLDESSLLSSAARPAFIMTTAACIRD